MGKVDIGIFSLVIYEPTNDEHQLLAKTFEEEEDFCTYVGEFKDIYLGVKNAKVKGRYSELYFAYIGDVLIGMIGLIWLYNSPNLDVGILPNYRGKHYSKILISEYVNYVFNCFLEFDELYALIDPDNIYSIQNAIAAGFKKINSYKYVKKRN